MEAVEQISLSGVDAANAFPRVFQASQPLGLENAVEWVTAHRAHVEAQLNQSGAVLLRGFGLATDTDFDRIIRAFDWPNFTYADSLSNAVRRNRTERVFTANEAPPDVSIFLHHEMAQTPIYPSRLFFFCEQPAQQGGATPICRSDQLLTRLAEAAPEFVQACETKGVTYSQTMPPVEDLASGQGRSWRSTLSADDQPAAEAKLRQLGYQWQWQDDESLSVTTPLLPAVRELADGSRSFFNQLIAAFFGWQDARNDSQKAIRFGDGSAIDADAMALAVQLAEELTVDLAWQRGDVAIVDNFRVMHGRRSFQGERRVLASLVA
jgi:alpha-ketoglutarate-dependent taurine dioxygenase